MRRAVLFETFAYQCPFSYSFGRGEINNGYNCKHPKQENVEDVGYKGKKKCGCCYSSSCPLGIEAEQQDLTDRESPDAVKDDIDWDGLCESGEVAEGEYLLIVSDETATEEEKEALYYYDRYMHRYDKKWLDEHGIENSLVC